MKAQFRNGNRRQIQLFDVLNTTKIVKEKYTKRSIKSIGKQSNQQVGEKQYSKNLTSLPKVNSTALYMTEHLSTASYSINVVRELYENINYYR